MTNNTTFVRFRPDSKKGKSEVPKTLTWNNAPMIRNHSIVSVCREILALIIALDVVKINIIGTPSTGKTTLAELIAHICHKYAKIPFTVKKFTRHDLLNFEATLSSLHPTNYIFIFDDISFLTASSSGRQIKQIEKAFTEIRHLPGGQDVKIIVIFNFHYNMAISKYMRQSDFFFWTSIGSSELENTQKIIGTKFTAKIMDFKRVYQEAVSLGKFSFQISKKGPKFEYPFRKPFGPVFFFNGSTARTVVYPIRTWVDQVCTNCANSTFESIKESADLKEFNHIAVKKFGKSVLKQAMRIKLFNMGIDTYSKRVKQAMKFIELNFNSKTFNIEELAEFYDLKQNKTRLDLKDEYKPVPGRIYTGLKD